MLSKRARADLALCLCSLIWGSTFVIVKDALADVSVVTYLAVRFVLAASVMGLLYWRSLIRMSFQTIWAGVQIGFFMLGGYLFQTTGIKFTTPSKAAFITGFSVILVPIFLAPFGKRRINGWSWAGALTALLGLYFLTIPREGLTGLNIGDLLVLICAAMFALHVIFVGRHTESHPVGALSFLQVATTAVISTAIVPIFTVTGWETPRIILSRTLVLAVLITAIGSTVVGFSLQVWAQRYTSAAHAAVIFSLEPVFALATSWLMAGERFSGRALCGGFLILAGVLVVELGGPMAVAPESPEPILPTAGSSS